MKKSILTVLLAVLILFPVSSSVERAMAAEFGSVYVWYAGANVKGAPPTELKSKQYFYTYKKNEFIETVTVKGYGPYVKRLHIVFQDRKGYKGSSLVKLAQVQRGADGLYTYTYEVTDKKRWIIASLEYKTLNFSPINRVYTEPSLFWIDKVNDYQMDSPSDEDDITP